MKRCLLLVFCFFLAAPAGFAVDKEVIQLQQNVALLQGMMRELQRSFDEKMAIMQTLIGQSSDKFAQLGQSGSQLNSSLSALEKAVQTSMANNGQKIDNLNSEVQGMQASLDELRARLDKISDQVAKLASAAQTIPSGSATPPGSAPMNFPAAPPPAGFPDAGGAPASQQPSPDLLYNTALRDYTEGNYPLAMQEFNDYLHYFPGTTLASNAQFYVGDIYYQQGQFNKAIEQYDKAIEQYPNGNKTAASQLKKGYAYLNMDMRAKGTLELNSLIKRFPNSPEAALASEKLAGLGPAKPIRKRPAQ